MGGELFAGGDRGAGGEWLGAGEVSVERPRANDQAAGRRPVGPQACKAPPAAEASRAEPAQAGRACCRAGQSVCRGRGGLLRTWTDSTGKFKIEASFAGKEGDNVLLTKTDGKTIKLPLAKLSKEDQDHVAGLDAKPPMRRTRSMRPSKSATARVDRVSRLVRRRANPAAAGRGLAARRPMRRSRSREALAAQGDRPAGRRSGAVFREPGEPAIRYFQNEAVVVLINGPPGKDREVTIVHCDLKTGKVAAESPWMTSFTPVDLSPRGNSWLACPISSPATKAKRTKSRSSAAKANEWTPASAGRWAKGSSSRRSSISSLSGRGQSPGLCRLWRQRDPDANRTGQGTLDAEDLAKHQPALSANRNQLAAAIDGGIGIFSTASGETLARINTDKPAGPTLSFSPTASGSPTCQATVIARL